MRRTILTAVAAFAASCMAKCDAPSAPAVGTTSAGTTPDGGPNVRGRVIDAETGAGVAAARVVVAGSGGTFGFAGAAAHEIAADTAADGRFELLNIMGRNWPDSPPHVFVVTASGYVKDSFRMHENRLDVAFRVVRDEGIDVACTGSPLATFHSIDGHLLTVRVDSSDLERSGLRRNERVLTMDGETPDGLGDVGLGRLIGRRAGREVDLRVRPPQGGDGASRDVRFVATRCGFGEFGAETTGAAWGE